MGNVQVAVPRPWTHNEGRYLSKVLASERIKFRLVFALVAVAWLACVCLIVVFVSGILFEYPILAALCISRTSAILPSPNQTQKPANA
jgi:hypothetical protein